MTSPVTLILLGQACFIGSALGFPPIVPNWYEENRGEIQLQLQPDVPPVVQISKRPILESTQNEPEFTAIKRDDDKSTSGIVAHGVDRNAVKLNTAGKISENESDQVITIKNSDRESKSFIGSANSVLPGAWVKKKTQNGYLLGKIFVNK